jgi:hypothetical protein
MPDADRPAVPRDAALLGFAGLIPFFGLSLAAIALGGETGTLALRGLVLYGAAILSFMGGCRWGFAAAGLGDGPVLKPLAISVLPALWAWAAVWLLPATLASGLLALGFGALYLNDTKATRSGGAPAWWARLRLPLSVGAMGACVIGMLA